MGVPLAFFRWRGKVYSVSIPLGLVVAAIVAIVTAVMFWLRGM